MDDGPVGTGLGSGQVSHGLDELLEGDKKPDDVGDHFPLRFMGSRDQ